MIEVIGIPGSHEYEVALAIKSTLVAQWPGIDTSPAAEEIVKIALNGLLRPGSPAAQPRLRVVRD